MLINGKNAYSYFADKARKTEFNDEVDNYTIEEVKTPLMTKIALPIIKQLSKLFNVTYKQNSLLPYRFSFKK